MITPHLDPIWPDGTFDKRSFLFAAKYLDELALMGLKVCVEKPLVLASFWGENTERLSRLGNFS
jgi:hypothetical protein